MNGSVSAPIQCGTAPGIGDHGSHRSTRVQSHPLYAWSCTAQTVFFDVVRVLSQPDLRSEPRLDLQSRRAVSRTRCPYQRRRSAPRTAVADRAGAACRVGTRSVPSADAAFAATSPGQKSDVEVGKADGIPGCVASGRRRNPTGSQRRKGVHHRTAPANCHLAIDLLGPTVFCLPRVFAPQDVKF